MTEGALLTPSAARALREDARTRGVEIEHPLDAALSVASVGFRDMDRSTLEELSGLFALLWMGRPAHEEDRIREYVHYARTGDWPSARGVDEGRALFETAVRGLPEESRQRLATLVEMAIIIGLRSRRESAERARLAASNPVDLPGGAPEVVASPDPRKGREVGRHRRARPSPPAAARSRAADERAQKEAYWRRRAASARAAVERAEGRLRELEERARRLGPYIPGPNLPACQEGTGVSMARGVIALRDDSVGAVSCSGEVQRTNEARQVNRQVELARVDLKRKRQALDDLAEEARRAGALPGWLR